MADVFRRWIGGVGVLKARSRSRSSLGDSGISLMVDEMSSESCFEA
jgi:hypothetical protein